jgi:hypothetical protein
MTIKSLFEDVVAKVKPQVNAAINKQVAQIQANASNLFQQSKMTAVNAVIATPQVTAVVQEYKAAEIQKNMPLILAAVAALLLIGYYARK